MPEFNPWLYTVDQLLPIVDFGYNKWVTSGPALYISVAISALGWILATALIAATASILRRGD